MTLQTRDACGFNNGLAKITYTFDDSLSPPVVTEIRLVNNGPAATFNVDLLSRTDGSTVQSFSRAAQLGADLVLPRTAPGQQPSIQHVFGGDLLMVDTVGRDSSHGWAFPFFYSCWSS